MFRLLVILSLIQCHLTVIGLTLPILTNVTAGPEASSVNLNADPHCPPEETSQRHLPQSRDCIDAVRLLPQNDYIGHFHIGGDDSLWRLPHSASYGTCKVQVSLDADVDLEMGSWDDVRAAGIKLVLWCRLAFGSQGQQKTGGWVSTGAENKVMVELIELRFSDGNGTGEGIEPGTNVVDVE